MTETPTNATPAPRELWLALRHGCGLSTRRLGDLAGKHSTAVLRATPAQMWDMLPDAEKLKQEAAARAYLSGDKAAAAPAPEPTPAAPVADLTAGELEAAPAKPKATKAAKPETVTATIDAMTAKADRAADREPSGRPPVFADPGALPNAGWGNLTAGRKPSGLQTLRLWLTGKSADIDAVKAFLKQFGPKAAKVAGLIVTEAADAARKAPQRPLDPTFPRPNRDRVQVAVMPDKADRIPEYLAEHGPDLGRAALAVLFQEAANPSRTVPEYLAAVAKPARKR